MNNLQNVFYISVLFFLTTDGQSSQRHLCSIKVVNIHSDITLGRLSLGGAPE